MKTFVRIAVAVALTTSVHSEMRVWNSLPGKTIEAEYVKIQFDNVILKDVDGKELKIPLTAFSGEDLTYIELENPPKLSVDPMRSSNQEFIPQTPFKTGGIIPDPPTLLIFQFGARVKQKDAKTYNHPLTVEVYAFGQQRYDPAKYRLIIKDKSKPFVLSKENDRRYEYTSPKQYKFYSYELYVDYLAWRESRGEKFAESLILVRDMRGEIIAYNSSKNWLNKNLEKLEELPVGAWLNDDCIRTHPSVPQVTKKGGVDWL